MPSNTHPTIGGLGSPLSPLEVLACHRSCADGSQPNPPLLWNGIKLLAAENVQNAVNVLNDVTPRSTAFLERCDNSTLKRVVTGGFVNDVANLKFHHGITHALKISCDDYAYCIPACQRENKGPVGTDKPTGPKPFNQTGYQRELMAHLYVAYASVSMAYFIIQKVLAKKTRLWGNDPTDKLIMQTELILLTLPTVPMPRFMPPTIDMVKLQAVKIGLPDEQAEQFWYYFDSNGWRVGGKAKMKSWTSAMMTWFHRWRLQSTSACPVNGAVTVVMQREYERVVERMKTIRSTYGDMQVWSRGDKEEFLKLKARRDDLKKKLGIII